MYDPDEVAKCDDIDSFICCICLLLTKKPYVCKAKWNAIIWNKCLDDYKDKRCPLCRSEEGFYLSDLQASVQDESIILKWRYKDCEEDIKISEFTNHLKKCPNAPYRCSSFPYWKVIIKRKEMHTHKKECDFTKVRCRYFHSHIIIRKELESHERDYWEFRTMMCIGCKDNFYKSNLPGHIASCLEYPLEWMNCKDKVRRCDFNNHPTVWLKSMVKCLAFEKWEFITTRDKIEEHQRVCKYVYDYHLSIITELKENIKAKNKVITELSNKLKEESQPKGFLGFF